MLSRFILEAAPYFLGPLVLELPAEGLSYALFLERYTIFLLLFAVWFGAEFVLLKVSMPAFERAKSPGLSPSKQHFFSLVGLLSVIGSGFAFLLTLQSFRSAAVDQIFFFSLLALCLQALSVAFSSRNYPGSSLICVFLYYFLVGFLSFRLDPGADLLAYEYGPAVFCLASASLFCAWRLSALLQSKRIVVAAPPLQPENKAVTKKRKVKSPEVPAKVLPKPFYCRLYVVLLTLGPVLIGILWGLKELPFPYATLLLLVPVGSSLVKAALAARKDGVFPPFFSSRTSGLCLLYMGIILLIKLTF